LQSVLTRHVRLLIGDCGNEPQPGVSRKLVPGKSSVIS
jgi:hypothetical protein